jgi:hypothetical protein
VPKGSRRRRLLMALGLGAAVGAADAAQAQTWRTMSSARQHLGERSLDVAVEYGTGRLRVEPATGTLLYRFEMRYDEDKFRPVTAYDRDSGRLRVGMEGRERGGTRVREGGSASLALNPQVPTALRLDFGAGEADVDLGGLSLRGVWLSTGASETRVSFSRPNRIQADTVRLAAGAAALRVTGLGNARASRLEFEGGVGETTLDFTGQWDRGASAAVKMGIGSVTLRFPRDLGVSIVKNSFLTSFDAPGMTRRGNTWYSGNWNRAAHRLTLEIDAAIGSIDVQWVD